MRANTVVFYGVKRVGDSTDFPIITSAPLQDAIRAIANQLLTQTMATRFDISIGRDGEEVRRGLGLAKDKSAIVDDLMASLGLTAGDMLDGETRVDTE